MIKIIDDKFSHDEWDKKAHHPLQSWEWGEARKKTSVQILRIAEFNKDTLLNVFQFTIHPIPKTGFKIGYLPRSIWPSDNVLDFIKDYAEKNNFLFIKLEPYIEKDNLKIENFKLKIQRSPHPLFPDWTMILDLRASEDELLKNMKSKTRYNIRLAQKKGVTVQEMSDKKGFEIFSKLYFETTQRQKYLGHNYEYHKIIWESLKDKMVHILIAFYNNIPLGAYELFIFKDRAYYPYGGSSDEYRNVMAPNLLMWEAIRFAKEKGALYFDMWGAAPPDAPDSDPYSGFTRFKEGYGAEFNNIAGSYDLIIRPMLYSIYNLVYKLRYFYYAKTL